MPCPAVVYKSREGNRALKIFGAVRAFSPPHKEGVTLLRARSKAQDIEPMRVFVSGGTGYIGRALTPVLLARGHSVCSLVRPGSERRLAPGCRALIGDALDAGTFVSEMPESDVLVHLTGVPHPSPSKAKQFARSTKFR